MIHINENYLKLKAGYLFPEISRRVADYINNNPDKKIIKLGIGDVTLPLTPSVIKAFHAGVDEMADEKTFKGYGPDKGYEFLQELILKNDFNSRGVELDTDEIFISDGAKCDSGNIQEIFSTETKIAVGDPVYPVYVDTNVMAGRTGEGENSGAYQNIIYMPCNDQNNFIPELPKEKPDLIYLCYPNNPTGATITKEILKKWIDFAHENKAVILYDAAYEAFITDDSLPHSVYEVDGARDVAIEFRSFSKTAGFTGTRLGYTVVPKTVMGYAKDGTAHSLHSLWARRQATKFNGVSYPVQCAGAAIYSVEGKKEIKDVINYYMQNASLMRDRLTSFGYDVYGGVNAPYVWVKTKNGLASWDFFDKLLHEVHVVGTPGSGFGKSGEGYFRFSAFGDKKNVQEAMDRIVKAGI